MKLGPGHWRRADMSNNDEPVPIGIIGGSGLYEMDGFSGREEIVVTTPFGAPSETIVGGWISGRRVYFRPRHGRGHRMRRLAHLQARALRHLVDGDPAQSEPGQPADEACAGQSHHHQRGPRGLKGKRPRGP